MNNSPISFEERLDTLQNLLKISMGATLRMIVQSLWAENDHLRAENRRLEQQIKDIQECQKRNSGSPQK